MQEKRKRKFHHRHHCHYHADGKVNIEASTYKWKRNILGNKKRKKEKYALLFIHTKKILLFCVWRMPNNHRQRSKTFFIYASLLKISSSCLLLLEWNVKYVRNKKNVSLDTFCFRMTQDGLSRKQNQLNSNRSKKEIFLYRKYPKEECHFRCFECGLFSADVKRKIRKNEKKNVENLKQKSDELLLVSSYSTWYRVNDPIFYLKKKENGNKYSQLPYWREPEQDIMA